MTSKKRIFVTGATGFVGANLVRALLKKNYEIHILLRKDAKIWRIKDIKKQLFTHTGELDSEKDLAKILKKCKPDYIFHLAAYGAYSSQTNLQKMIQTNIVGFSNLLHASKDLPYKLLINTGSSSEYGYKKKPMKESDILEPDSYYAATKAAATHVASVFAKKENKPIITFRLFSVYGPYEELTRLIPTAILSALNKKPLPLTTGPVKRDFVYVQDVVTAYLQAIKSPQRPGDVFNIGTGKQWDNKDVACIIKDLNHGYLNIQKGAFPQRKWDTSYWIANTQKSKKILRWQASKTLQQGLRDTFKWFQNHKGIYEKI